jgi:Sulfotransferase domain
MLRLSRFFQSSSAQLEQVTFQGDTISALKKTALLDIAEAKLPGKSPNASPSGLSVPTQPGRKTKLDFMIIGAQKSGTTSLHKYLERHPRLYMLPEKEIPFFTNAEYCAKGWQWYSDSFFNEAPPEKLWGKSTPAYMTSLEVPRRIFNEMPHVKLIALLRNPIERAYSHYKMMVKRELEPRTFLEVLDEKLKAETVQRERLFPPGTEDVGYVAMGEYSLILEEYYKVFPREQLLVLFTDDLKRDPAGVLKRVMRFLGLDEDFSPPNLGKYYHVGGMKRRIPLAEADLARHPLFRKFLLILPQRLQFPFERRFLFWYMIWNTKPDPEKGIPPGAYQRLARFYQEDVRKLSRLIGAKVPWPEFADC